ncbi:hypothetical protein BGZ76_009428 [Entomortierella beljakovae]|nr:hypothetical protein BGZ76_009428 [Entomortierella beljakovae]
MLTVNRPRAAPSITNSDKPALSTQEIKSMAFGKSNNIRSRTKLPASGDKASGITEHKEIKEEQHDVHPAERVFTPIVTCRYPEADWKDAESFPAFLPMSESEIEYAKSIKSKIFREKKLLKSLQLQLREEKTIGRRARQTQLSREILDCEEKLSLLCDQMKPWKGLFVEADDAWIPRCIGLVSTVPYHYLLRDWLLAVIVACSGGVDHSGMSLTTSFRLESYVKNLIHEVNLPPFGKVEIGITINNRLIYASRPALNSVPIVKNFSLYPLFRCLTAEDIVTVIEVILSEGKIIFVSSFPGMLTLASESFLYLLFPLYWQGVYIPILPSALMTCLQAPVPYIIGIERRSCDAEFPPEEACVIDLDKGRIEVQLAPTSLPPRQRRKLIQCLEQYAPTCAIRRSPTTNNPALGPPAYVKEAFPHSRLTLFCGVSRAPRPIKRMESRPHSAIMNGLPNGIPMDSRGNGSTNTLSSFQGDMNKGDQGANQPLSYSKVAGGMARSASEGILDRNPESNGVSAKEALNRAESMKEASPSSMHSTDSFKSSPRKVLSPGRSRTSMFEPRRQELTSSQLEGTPPQHPGYNRQNSNSTQMSSVIGAFESPALRHRGSFTSIESSSSSVLSKSPVSTTTSSTMASINGHSSPTAALSSEDEVGPNALEKTPPTLIEGHVLTMIPSPLPMSLQNCRCGLCSQGFASHHIVYRCESCSLYVHAGCLDELLYPCVRGFDESGVCWSVLQMWAGLMKGYRTGIIAGAALQQYNQNSPQQHQYQHYPPRVQGHVKQLSNSGSEGEREGRDRLSWASFQRWTGRNSSQGGNIGNTKNMNGMAPLRASSNVETHHQSPITQKSQVATQPHSRPRNGTDSSNHSDTVSFHRDVFIKGVDKEAKQFMSMFTESQAFVQFIQDRVDRSPGDPEIMFFDEVIKAKINRSRFRLGKEETKFLDDPSYGVQGTVKAIPPSGDIQIYDNDERRFPTKLEPAYF